MPLTFGVFLMLVSRRLICLLTGHRFVTNYWKLGNYFIFNILFVRVVLWLICYPGKYINSFCTDDLFTLDIIWIFSVL